MFDDKEHATQLLKENLLNKGVNIKEEDKEKSNKKLAEISRKNKVQNNPKHKQQEESIKDKEDTKLTKNKLFNIFIKMSRKSFQFIITMMSYFLVESVTLMFLGHSDVGLININAAQIGILYINIFAFMLFTIGSMRSFEILGAQAYGRKDYELLCRIFDEAKIFCVLIFLMVMLPICFTSNYVLGFLGISEEMVHLSSNFIRINIISVFFILFYFLNLRFLHILGFHNLILAINFI